MRWFEALTKLTQEQTPLVIVTLVSVRGHAPREAGAKMLVTQDNVFDTIGGGNLEQTMVHKARVLLTQNIPEPQMHTIRLTENGSAEYGVQCCGGEVTVLLEPLITVRSTVAIFGVGHVGLALAKVLSILPIDLWLIDSRIEMLEPSRLKLQDSQAKTHIRHLPILDGVVQDLPSGSHVVVMTHDHAEDLFVLEMCLKRNDLRFIGLIGSEGKWQNFKHKLLSQGFTLADLSRITTPIGIPEISSKRPEAIAIATAAQLMPYLIPASKSKGVKHG
jgi:xanthine dehydrogenase accessory factor